MLSIHLGILALANALTIDMRDYIQCSMCDRMSYVNVTFAYRKKQIVNHHKVAIILLQTVQCADRNWLKRLCDQRRKSLGIGNLFPVFQQRSIGW